MQPKLSPGSRFHGCQSALFCLLFLLLAGSLRVQAQATTMAAALIPGVAGDPVERKAAPDKPTPKVTRPNPIIGSLKKPVGALNTKISYVMTPHPVRTNPLKITSI